MTASEIHDNSSAVKVAFIGATGRSGSTLVARVLGGASGACSVGELCWIWNYGLLNDRPCGCGQPFRSCEFWSAVGEQGFGGWSQLDARRLNDARRALVRTRALPGLWRAQRGIGSPLLQEYVDTLSTLYSAIRDVSGARFVVDNSKQAAAALVVASTPRVDLRLLHLVRTPQGVAHSWTKHVARDDLGGGEMRRRGPVRTALRWDADNLLLDRMAARGTQRAVVRYDDFVTDARSTTLRMLRFLDEPADDLSYVGADWADLGMEHSVWGNPMRSRDGRETIRRDDAWRTQMAPRDVRLVTALTSAVDRRRRG